MDGGDSRRRRLLATIAPPLPYHNVLHRQLLAASILDAFGRFARGELLDVGCGTKPYAAIAEGLVDTYVGLDVEDRGAADVIGSALEMPFEGQSFDTVVSFQVLEHVTQPCTMLRECARVLRPGGHLILTAPFAWRIHEEPNDYFRFSEFGLASLVDQAGLEMLNLEPMGGLWVYVATQISYFLYGRSRAKGAVNRLACLSVQRLGAALDCRYPERASTHNYTLVARKRSG